MRSGYSLWLAATLLASPAPALAQQFNQQSAAKELVEPAMTLTVPRKNDQSHADDEEAAKKKKKAELLVVPIPMSNPALGTGLTVAAVLFYNPNNAPQPWISGVGGGYTSTKTWGAGAFHSMSLAHDRARILAFAGYGDARLNFYGIGSNAGEAGVSIDMEDKGLVGILDGQARLFKKGGFLGHIYAGARIQYLHLDSTAELPPISLPNRPDLVLPPIELKSTNIGIGPSFTFDSRNESLNPRKGVYVTGTWLFGAKFLGGDFSHNKLNFAANAYFPLSKTTVLGIRKQLCGVKGDAPFYDLCMFGQQGDLRGYETGRYRDGASWALQAEVRQHLFWKIGVVGFAGVGGIAESTSAIWKHSKVLYSGGGGIRFLASKRNNVNLRLDVAWGKDGSAIYFGIGEAF